MFPQVWGRTRAARTVLCSDVPLLAPGFGVVGDTYAARTDDHLYVLTHLSGVTDHHVADDAIVDHIVKLVEAKAADIEAAKLAATAAAAE